MASQDTKTTPVVSQIDTNVTPPPAAAIAKETKMDDTLVQETPRTSNASTPRTANGTNPFDTDLEAMLDTNAAHNKSTTITPSSTRSQWSKLKEEKHSDNQVWPGKDYWKQKAKAAKVKRSWCGCMARMSYRNRVILKIMIVVFIVGAAVAIGFGVSKPLGAQIWHSN